MKTFVFYIGWLWSFICPKVVINKIEGTLAYLFAGFCSRRFKFFGKNTLLGRHTTYIGEKHISLGNNVQIGDYGRLTAYDYYQPNDSHFSPEIVLGDGCAIGPQSHITAINQIILGKNVLTGPRVLISDNAHGGTDKDTLKKAPLIRPLTNKGPILIDDNVWIGEGVMIIGSVHIGEGAVIAANSVVNHDVPAYCVVAGSPAQIVKSNK